MAKKRNRRQKTGDRGELECAAFLGKFEILPLLTVHDYGIDLLCHLLSDDGGVLFGGFVRGSSSKKVAARIYKEDAKDILAAKYNVVVFLVDVNSRDVFFRLIDTEFENTLRAFVDGTNSTYTLSPSRMHTGDENFNAVIKKIKVSASSFSRSMETHGHDMHSLGFIGSKDFVRNPSQVYGLANKIYTDVLPVFNYSGGRHEVSIDSLIDIVGRLTGLRVEIFESVQKTHADLPSFSEVFESGAVIYLASSLTYPQKRWEITKALASIVLSVPSREYLWDLRNPLATVRSLMENPTGQLGRLLEFEVVLLATELLLPPEQRIWTERHGSMSIRQIARNLGVPERVLPMWLSSVYQTRRSAALISVFEEEE